MNCLSIFLSYSSCHTEDVEQHREKWRSNIIKFPSRIWSSVEYFSFRNWINVTHHEQQKISCQTVKFGLIFLRKQNRSYFKRFRIQKYLLGNERNVQSNKSVKLKMKRTMSDECSANKCKKNAPFPFKEKNVAKIPAFFIVGFSLPKISIN